MTLYVGELPAPRTPIMKEDANGTKRWYLGEQYHREDGPAIIWRGGHVRWYLYDRIMSFEEWLALVGMDDEEKVMLKLEYG